MIKGSDYIGILVNLVCEECCMGCEAFPRAKDKKRCPTYKERSKAVNRSIYKLRKEAKLRKQEIKGSD